jgi:hypothetical protein
MTITAPFREFVQGDISSYDVTGDLTTMEYCAVQLDTTYARTVEAWTAGPAVGVLTNKPIAEASATSTKFQTVAQVQWRGKCLLKAGSGGLAVGDWVKITTGGVGIKATPADKDIIFGQCEVAAADGYPATVRIEKMYVSMT